MFLPKLILDKIGLIQGSVNGTEGVAFYDWVSLYEIKRMWMQGRQEINEWDLNSSRLS